MKQIIPELIPLAQTVAGATTVTVTPPARKCYHLNVENGRCLNCEAGL